jgi:hypothetical protein
MAGTRKAARAQIQTTTAQVNLAVVAEARYATAAASDAVTVVEGAAGWAVYDVEPASAGNTG